MAASKSKQDDLKPFYESMSTVLSINVPKEYPGKLASVDETTVLPSTI